MSSAAPTAREFDIQAMRMDGEPAAIWDSALRNASSPEAPHIYKKDGYYYLVIAEGGTEHYHAVTVARSKDIKGWYEGNPANPVMTHRQFGFHCPIANVGHADLVETPEGNWYAVLLASRTFDGIHKNFGRETFICPVIWERGWPVFSPLSGKIDWEYPADEHLPWTEYEKERELDDFDSDKLALCWNFWGTPFEDFWNISESCLNLKCLKRPVTGPLKPMQRNNEKIYNNCISFVGRRQTYADFEASCKMMFMPEENECAGFIVMQAMNHQYKVQRVCKDGKQFVQLVLSTAEFDVPAHFPGFTSETKETVLNEIPWNHPDIVIHFTARGEDYNFYCGTSADAMEALYEHADGRLINPEKVGGMVGTMLGMFASANGNESHNYAAFDWFKYGQD